MVGSESGPGRMWDDCLGSGRVVRWYGIELGRRQMIECGFEGV